MCFTLGKNSSSGQVTSGSNPYPRNPGSISTIFWIERDGSREQPKSRVARLPGRSKTAASPERSSTVDSRPTGVRPPTRISATRSPSSSTCAARARRHVDDGTELRASPRKINRRQCEAAHTAWVPDEIWIVRPGLHPEALRRGGRHAEQISAGHLTAVTRGTARSCLLCLIPWRKNHAQCTTDTRDQ
jgi:hypothetical protein